METKLKRTISIILSLTLMLGMMSVLNFAAFADSDTYVITSGNFSDYFDESGYLKDSVPEGSVLDFQGTFSGNAYTLYINKKVTVTSSTADAVFDSNTNNADDCISFNIVAGADYTTVSKLEFKNCDFFIVGASNVTVDSIKMVSNLEGVGSGTGFLSIHSGAYYTTVKNSYFENGGTGSASVVTGCGSAYTVFDNNNCIATGQGGNVLYASAYNGTGDYPHHITYTNNTITTAIVGDYSTSRMYGIVVCGEGNVIEGNKFNNFKGNAITTQFGGNASDSIYKNNILPGDASMTLGSFCTAEGNEIGGSITIAVEDVVTNNTIGGKVNVNGRDTQIIGNTISDQVTINKSSYNTVFTDNTVHKNVSVKSTDNKIIGNTVITSDEYAVTLASSVEDTEVTDNVLVAADKTGNDAVDPGNGTGNTIANNKNINEFMDRWIQPIADVTYTGKPIEPDVVVKAGDKTLIRGTDYEVDYSNNTNAGTATVTIKPVDGSIYSGTATASFKIRKADLTISKLPAAVEDLVYTGQSYALVSAGTVENGMMLYALGNEEDATGAYAETVPEEAGVGTYYVWYKAVGDDNHNDTAPACVTVTIAGPDKTELNAAITAAEDLYGIIKDNANYSDVATALNEAITAARHVAGSDTVTAEDVASATETVTTAKQSAEAIVNDPDTIPLKYVVDKINELPEASKVKTSDRKTIVAARNAYEELSEDQKAKVDAVTLKKLVDAEAALAAAELKAAKKEAQAAMNEQVTVTQKSTKFTVKWKKSSSADGYYVYAAYYGKKATKPVKTIKKNSTVTATISKIGGKKINAKKNFYVYVAAYKIIDGKKVTIGKSMAAYLAGTKNKTYSNVKKLTIKKSKFTLKAGKTAKIKATVTLANKKRKHLPKSYAAKFRYKSSDTSIATVSKNGTIKALKKGSCTIYVYSVNGLVKKAKVTI